MLRKRATLFIMKAMASLFVYIMYLYNLVLQTNEIKPSRSVTEMNKFVEKFRAEYMLPSKSQ